VLNHIFRKTENNKEPFEEWQWTSQDILGSFVEINLFQVNKFIRYL
jgi:hypothetical protein